MQKLAIIGAGFSGLILANELKDFFNITLFEKSRNVGGRVATRYSNLYEFDHGAQFFHAKSKEFIEFTNDLIAKSIVKRWDARFVEIEGNKILDKRNWDDSFPHYVGVPKMNSVAKYLADGLDVKLNTKIIKIDKIKNKWQLLSSEGEVYNNFDWLVIAIPAEQAKELIYSKELDNIKMSSCFALMLGFKEAIDFGFDAALVKNTDISWISVNSSKPERKNDFSVIVLSTNKWANDNLEQEKEFVINHLLENASFVLNKSLTHADHIDLQKWRYANAAKSNLTSIIDKDKKLGLCGDWAVKGILEAAFLSAKDLAKEIRKSS